MSVAMPKEKVAVTLFNLRDFCQTESDLDRTLDKVCAIGYKSVQVSAVPLEAAVIRRQLDKHNLYCCAHHAGLDMLFKHTEEVIDFLHTLECSFTALGHPGRPYIYEPEKTRELVAMFNDKAPQFAEAGIKLAYHNHNQEFVKYDGTKETMLDYFYRNTDKKNVWAEIDTHWVARGGTCPIAWIKKLAGRIDVIHFKDLAIRDGEPFICEIGEGNLDWQGIVKACEETGVRFYSIEQDNEDYCHRDIFESIKMSFDYLKSIGVN